MQFISSVAMQQEQLSTLTVHPADEQLRRPAAPTQRVDKTLGKIL